MQPPLKCCGQSFELAAEGLTLPLKAAFTAVTGPKYRKPILKASSRPDIIVFMPNPVSPARLTTIQRKIRPLGRTFVRHNSPFTANAQDRQNAS